jgi:hypothetical protein
VKKRPKMKNVIIKKSVKQTFEREKTGIQKHDNKHQFYFPKFGSKKEEEMSECRQKNINRKKAKKA